MEWDQVQVDVVVVAIVGFLIFLFLSKSFISVFSLYIFLCVERHYSGSGIAGGRKRGQGERERGRGELTYLILVRYNSTLKIFSTSLHHRLPRFLPSLGIKSLLLLLLLGRVGLD